MNARDPSQYPYRKEFTLQVVGEFALFCRPGNAWNRVTYFAPTPSAIWGLVKSIYHSNYYFVRPVRVEVLNPLKTTSIPQTIHRNIVINSHVPVDTAKTAKAPQGAVYLQDVAYRITFEGWFPDEKKMRRLERMLTSGGFYNPPFLGTRECGADIVSEILGTDGLPKPPCKDITLHEPSMFVGDHHGEVVIRQGVVEYPDWTVDALLDLRRRRLDEAEAFAAEGASHAM